MKDYKIPKNNLGTDRLTVMNISSSGSYDFSLIDILSLMVYQEQKLYFTIEITSTKIKIYKNGLVYKELCIDLE